MLTIHKASLRNADYYLHLAREDYYFQGGEPPGQWHGRGAARLGLVGKVEKEQFQNLFQGFSPDGSQALVQNAGQQSGYHRRCPAWDLTYSPPKSVTVKWAEGPHYITKTIENGQDEAVRAASSLMEDFAAVTRRGSGGRIREKASFCYALFEHGTSRNQDPQLHTHVICFNLAVRDDGTTGAVRSNSLFELKMAVGALYRCHLATALQRDLGLQVEKVESWFEIQGVNRGLADRFSSRRKEVTEYCQQHGVHGAIEAEKAAIATRAVKGHVARETLLQQWQQVGKEYGWGQPQVLSPVQPQEHRPEPSRYTQQVAQRIRETVGASAQSREWIRALEEAAVARQTAGLYAHEVVASVLISNEQIVKSQRFLEAPNRTLFPVAQDPAHQNANTQSVTQATPRQASDQVENLPGPTLALNQPASKGQYDWLLELLDSLDKQPDPRVGQTKRGAHTRTPLVVIKIRDEVPRFGKPIRSLDLRFFALEKRPERVFPNLPWWNPLQRVRRPVLFMRVENDPFGLKRRWTIPLDRARRAAARKIQQAIVSALEAGARMILLDDHRFDSLVKGVQRARTLLRQATRPRIVLAPTASDAWRILLRDWCDRGISRPDEVVILTQTANAAGKLNAAAQNMRRRAGKIGLAQFEVGTTTLSYNDRVIFWNGRRGVVEPHDAGTVTKISKKRIRLTLDNGRKLDLPIKECPPIKLGYAMRHRDASPTWRIRGGRTAEVVEHQENDSLGLHYRTHLACRL